MVAVSGTAGGGDEVTVRVGVAGGVVRVRVGVGVGVLVVLVGVGLGDVRVAVGVAVRVAVCVCLCVGVAVGLVGWLDARDEVFELVSAGIAISAPMTKNTAAMMILGSCIVSSSRSSGCYRHLDHSLPKAVLCRLPQGEECVTGQLSGAGVAALWKAA